MRSSCSTLGCGLALMVLGGCTFVDHRATLNPTLQVAQSTIGGGRPVQVRVVDERPRTMIGRRGAGGQIGGTITSTQDPAEVVRSRIVEGLQRNGFTVIGADQSGTSTMNVELRALEYELVMGFWTGSANARAALKAICRSGNETYERLYRGERKRAAFFVPSGGKTDRMLNEALSDVLGKTLEDQALLRCLAA